MAGVRYIQGSLSRPCSATRSGMGHFTRGAEEDPQTASWEEVNILSSGISLDLSHFNRSRLRAPGEGREGVQMGRNGHPASPNSPSTVQFWLLPPPLSSSLWPGPPAPAVPVSPLEHPTLGWKPAAPLCPAGPMPQQASVQPMGGGSFCTPPLLSFPAQ